MYTYTIITPTTFQVQGDNYNATYNGDETLAIETTDRLNNNALNAVKNKKITSLHKIFQEKVDEIKASVPEYEAETWSTQSDEWVAFTRDNATPTPICDMIAATRGIDRLILMEKIGGKVGGMFTLLGMQQSAEDGINELTTIQEVNDFALPTL